jgi:hypothetical protein
MVAENPSPDNDTMENLIETNEQLSKAISQHQRAVLQARKAAGLNGGITPPPPAEFSFAPPSGPPPTLSKSTAPVRKVVGTAPQIPPPGDYAPTGSDNEDDARPRHDPFADPKESVTRAYNPPFPRDEPTNATGQFIDRLGIEPYHPGFRETKSYVGRQDSSMGQATMHTAVQEDDPPSPEAGRTGGGSSEYGVQAGNKAPIYRY